MIQAGNISADGHKQGYSDLESVLLTRDGPGETLNSPSAGRLSPEVHSKEGPASEASLQMPDWHPQVALRRL